MRNYVLLGLFYLLACASDIKFKVKQIEVNYVTGLIRFYMQVKDRFDEKRGEFQGMALDYLTIRSSEFGVCIINFLLCI